jgi:hypothetical protein
MVGLGCSCLAGVGFAAWSFFNNSGIWLDRGELIAVIGLFVGFGLCACYCFAEYFNTRGTYDENVIDFSTPWTGRKAEQWGDLESVTLSSAGWYVLTFRTGTKIRLSTMLGGSHGVLELLDQKGFHLK